VAAPEIADYALLGDCQGAALVSRDGSVDWWCAPRFDAPAVFARLLDPAAGHFAVRPTAPAEVTRRYVGATMVLETTFVTRNGRVRLTDALALGEGEREHGIGKGSPHVLLRRAEVLEGRVELDVSFAPRPEYGLVTPKLVRVEGGTRSVGGPHGIVLESELDLDEHGRARTRLQAGETLAFALRHFTGLAGPPPTMPLDVDARLADTEAAWRSWDARHVGYDGAYADAVRRSTCVLQALTYQPSGAVIAAPTTSLPEVAGGPANWDYRYAWLRDASLTLRALWVGACPDEAERFFGWMAAAAGPRGKDGRVQVVFGVEGERDLAERELPHLAGFGGARPVRVGNAAWEQRQLDVLGEVLDGAWLLREQLGELEPLTAAFLAELADLAAEGWREPDAGIWEGREGERHYTSSKLFCWVALDRAVHLADRLHAGAERREGWARARDEVRETILREAWSEERGAYGGALGSDHLDASVLLMPIFGLLPAQDERMRATTDLIASALGQDGLVRRWTGGNDEGGFAACSFWLAECHALGGDLDRAREVFEATLGYANDVGLLAEEVDPATGRQLGNFPQGLSHMSLINAAWRIHEAGTAPGGDQQAE